MEGIVNSTLENNAPYTFNNQLYIFVIALSVVAILIVAVLLFYIVAFLEEQLNFFVQVSIILTYFVFEAPAS
jgi:hypothetical protein